MLQIYKQEPPRSFVRHQRAFNAEFNNIPRLTKLILKKSLLEEQGFLCAYCMSKINCDNIKIEHWRSQSKKKYPFLQLAYSNLFAVCNGNENNPPSNQYCDTKKGNKDLKFNLANQNLNIEEIVYYSSSGEIKSIDADFEDELNEVLGLNISQLKDSRKKVLDSIINIIMNQNDKHSIQNFIQRWSSIDSSGHKKPYCAVALYFLRKKLVSCRE
ncbi:MAG: hypothetical protein PHQ22_04775 [Sulfuricurvum sp.]|nr:hypothetical protein [Sulfuricurvum sp.]MDD5386492.1 hypothetical protein [Sulfuricurvum sp.]